jgi:hypothetical protein
MHNDRGTARIRHREYVQDLSTSVGFSNTTFEINPTNTQLFPWLSALAQNYEQYKILGMVVEIKSLSASALNSTNTALGSLSVATQYNALDAPFVNKQQVLNYQFATSCKPSESMVHPIECDPTQTPNQPLYVRIGSQTEGDARLYSMGVINFVSVGAQAASVACEMWISYDILLIKPRLSSGLGLALRTAFYTCAANVDDPSGTVFVDDTAPMGQLARAEFDGIGLEFKYTLSADPAGELDCEMFFPIGCEGLYLTQLTWFGTGVPRAAAQKRGTIVYTGCSLRTHLYNVTAENAGSSDVGINAGVANTNAMSTDNIISIPNPNIRASIKWIAGNDWSVPTSNINSVMNIVVAQLNGLIERPASLAHSGVYAYTPGDEVDEKDEHKQAPSREVIIVEEPDDFVHEGDDTAGGPSALTSEKIPAHALRRRLPKKA